ncbi:MAG: alanine--tRNA ligase, partial [Inquilinus sp.]|nr:alanine--tRNA ligase [Inquilinus sp.]
RHWAGSGDVATEQVWFDIRDKVGATDFLGYGTVRAEGQVMALVVDGKTADKATAGQQVAVIANQTPFYGESGGQVGDAGGMFTAAGCEVEVADTQKKLGDLFVHLGRVTKGTLSVGDAVDLSVDSERRDAVRANHSATHLLHEALRRRLGKHVTQKGSLVAPDRLRFDISQPRAVNREDIVAVEAEVNARVREDAEVVTRLMTPDEAMAEGAMALFGEKYGETVRVVGMGREGNRFYSTELCGGTHVGRTGEIGSFRIIGEGAVAAGVRRIEAVTGAGAVEHQQRQEALLAEAASALKATPADLPGRIAALVEERRRQEREIADLRRALATGGGAGTAPPVKQVEGIDFSGRVLEGVPAKDLKPMADDIKTSLGSGVVALVAVNDGKASLVVGVTDDLTARLDAVALVRAGAAAVGGKGGGGRPDMAQAGGPEGGKAGDALAAIEAALAG